MKPEKISLTALVNPNEYLIFNIINLFYQMNFLVSLSLLNLNGTFSKLYSDENNETIIKMTR